MSFSTLDDDVVTHIFSFLHPHASRQDRRALQASALSSRALRHLAHQRLFVCVRLRSSSDKVGAAVLDDALSYGSFGYGQTPEGGRLGIGEERRRSSSKSTRALHQMLSEAPWVLPWIRGVSIVDRPSQAQMVDGDVQYAYLDEEDGDEACALDDIVLLPSPDRKKPQNKVHATQLEAYSGGTCVEPQSVLFDPLSPQILNTLSSQALLRSFEIVCSPFTCWEFGTADVVEAIKGVLQLGSLRTTKTTLFPLEFLYGGQGLRNLSMCSPCMGPGMYESMLSVDMDIDSDNALTMDLDSGQTFSEDSMIPPLPASFCGRPVTLACYNSDSSVAYLSFEFLARAVQESKLDLSGLKGLLISAGQYSINVHERLQVMLDACAGTLETLVLQPSGELHRIATNPDPLTLERLSALRSLTFNIHVTEMTIIGVFQWLIRTISSLPLNSKLESLRLSVNCHSSLCNPSASGGMDSTESLTTVHSSSSSSMGSTSISRSTSSSSSNTGTSGRCQKFADSIEDPAQRAGSTVAGGIDYGSLSSIENHYRPLFGPLLSLFVPPSLDCEESSPFPSFKRFYLELIGTNEYWSGSIQQYKVHAIQACMDEFERAPGVREAGRRTFFGHACPNFDPRKEAEVLADMF